MSSLSYLLAVLSSITYGTGDFLGGVAAKRTATVWVVAISQVSGLFLVILLLPMLSDATVEPRDVGWGLAAGVFGGSGVALLYRALAIGVMSVVAPATAVCAIAVPVLVGIGLGERPAPLAIAGIFAAVLAVILVSQNDDTRRRGLRVMGIAIASGILIGFFLVALERPSAHSGMWPLLIGRVVSISFFVPAALRNRSAAPRGAGAIGVPVACGLVDMLANVLYVFAVRLGALSVVAALTSLYPASTVLLARLVLHERLSRVQWMGVGCAAIAILLIVGS